MWRAIFRNAGIRPRALPASLLGWWRYLRERKAFRGMAGAGSMPWGRELPIFHEWEESSGTLGHYFFQDQLVARWIRSDAPLRHIDVGSRLDGFVGMLSVFREVEVIDIRPSPCRVPQVKFQQMDLMKELAPEWIACTDSLSCLHTIEHFGLGRYGDPLDPQGHEKGLAQLKRMVKPGGRLYLSTPIGPERIEFNAHRIFAVRTMLEWFAKGWEIERFAVVGDALEVHESLDWKSGDVEANFGCHLGVGILVARKTCEDACPP